MKRLLLPLLADLDLPTAANAESVWLIRYSSFKDGPAFEKVEMRDMEQCNEQAKKFSKEIPHPDFVCISGK